MPSLLDFEKPVAAIDAEIALLMGDPARGADLHRALGRKVKLLGDLYAKLTPWQKTMVARHPDRPRFSSLAAGLVSDFTPLAGDRAFADDPAIQGGLARFRGQAVMLIGHEKGHDTASRVAHNFGMAKPEGYRKAIRLMTMASRFGLPVVTLVDTPGAFPGIEAEERGQAEAIARATEACLDLDVPLVTAIVGEGGSGGAVALAAANRVLMFEHAVYSVISPEGCASILWRDAGKAADAAEAMKMTAPDLLRLGVADRIVDEPPGGAHRAPAAAIRSLGDAIEEELRALHNQPAATVKANRRERFLTSPIL
ncbi:acetyl-CoA carboxylase carboxyltransferase subunit alpha [Sandaracinobacteroides saxicola]|uniref:Acetyl-coenzyme A carboxylase carboxyl transferase subunit alpha n=1 Tax=Sandaracinobacteroides saxicola TaxID=2759707 RepID=A0A7G5IGA4_9SPHN|nr:acetyl-CoA carboxylase carboxyltransferase subunit alpha [Sandaracinobacteroides saxicola]QMW22396.1 acetyl-CoA carboxylase carboxyltransferase subunit alpha [Sandaracinobacteroides saxicola]